MSDKVEEGYSNGETKFWPLSRVEKKTRSIRYELMRARLWQKVYVESSKDFEFPGHFADKAIDAFDARFKLKLDENELTTIFDDLITIDYKDGEDPDEHHMIQEDICKENLLNLGCFIQKAFQLALKYDPNFIDVEGISAISLYKQLEKYFKGSGYKE